MGRQKQVYIPAHQGFPEDFPQRLDRLRDAAGLSWRDLARRLRVDARMMRRWRTGMRPDSGHLVALFSLADEMGLLRHLLSKVDDTTVVER